MLGEYRFLQHKILDHFEPNFLYNNHNYRRWEIYYKKWDTGSSLVIAVRTKYLNYFSPPPWHRSRMVVTHWPIVLVLHKNCCCRLQPSNCYNCFKSRCCINAWRHSLAVLVRLTHYMAKQRHQMEIFSALLAPCEGIHRSPVDSPHKGQWRRALILYVRLNKRLSAQSRC